MVWRCLSLVVVGVIVIEVCVCVCLLFYLGMMGCDMVVWRAVCCRIVLEVPLWWG